MTTHSPIIGTKVSQAKDNLYKETCKTTEKYSELLFFVMVKLTPVCWVMPKFAISLIHYYSNDLKSEALVLPVPKWQVDISMKDNLT